MIPKKRTDETDVENTPLEEPDGEEFSPDEEDIVEDADDDDVLE